MFSPVVYRTFFDEEKDPDANFESTEATHKSRYKKIVLFLFIYTLVAIASFIMVMIILYLFIFLLKPENGMSAWDYYDNILLSYTVGENKHSLIYMYSLILTIICVTYLVYIIYFAFVKDYFTNLTYQSYLPELSDKTEFTQPQKFIIFYGVMLLYIFTFIIFVINYLEYESTSIFFAVTFIILIMMVMVGKFYQQILKKDITKGIIWFFFVCFTPCLGLLLPKFVTTEVKIPDAVLHPKGIIKWGIISLVFIIITILTIIFIKAVNDKPDEN
jgi:hypothetical protein